MADYPVNKKKRHLLLFNRILKKELNEVLIKTPSKLSSDDINKLFDMIFIKKTNDSDDYYVPKKLKVKLRINEEDFKNLYKKKVVTPKPKPSPKPKPLPKPKPSPKPKPKPTPSQEEKENLDDALNFITTFNSQTPPNDFNKTNLGMKVYFMYILQKHKNDCLIINDTEGTRAIEWHFRNKQLSTNYDNNKSSENNIIQQSIEDCIKNKKRFIAIPLTLSKGNAYHQNMIIIDLVKMTVERFEPHGGATGGGGLEKTSDDLDKALKNKFEIEFKNYKFKYIPPSELCPRFTKQIINRLNNENDELNRFEGRQIGYQSLESLSRSGDKGWCVAWALFYLDSRLSAPSYTPQEIYKHMFNKLDTDPQNFLKFIRGYAEFLTQFYNKLFDDFISKFPVFYDLKELIYFGGDRKQLKKGLEALRNLGRDKYLRILNAFNKFINDSLISVAGDGNIND